MRETEEQKIYNPGPEKMGFSGLRKKLSLLIVRTRKK